MIIILMRMNENEFVINNEVNNMKSFKKSKPLVMYVDDDPDLLDIFGNFIESCGIDLMKFLNPIDAFCEIKNNPEKYQALITDFVMPEMTGLELLKKINIKGHYGINHFAVFSSMVGSESFLDKFKKEFPENIKPIILIDKINFSDKEGLKEFITNVIRDSRSSCEKFNN